MLAKLWCFVIGSVLITLGIVGNVRNITDRWEVVGILGLITFICAIVQVLWDWKEFREYIG